jgi:hypothetical protein
MRVRIKLAALGAVCLLTSCATAYQPDGVAGGYSDRRLAGNAVQVSFRGNRFNSPEMLQSYLLRRCADVTLQNGYDYFVVAPNAGPTNADGSKADNESIASATIQMYKGVKPGSDVHAYDAAAVVRSTPVDEGENAEAMPPPVSIANATAESGARIPAVNSNALTNEPPPFEKF